MSMYNFSDLIRRHSNPFELISNSEGSYVGGKWQSGSESVSVRMGAIVPLSERKIYQSGGTYTAKDRNLYTNEPIPDALKEAKVRYKGNEYKIEEEKNFEDYSYHFSYVLRWVSKFDKLSQD